VLILGMFCVVSCGDGPIDPETSPMGLEPRLGKEIFVRSKPHVFIGTIGLPGVDSTMRFGFNVVVLTDGTAHGNLSLIPVAGESGPSLLFIVETGDVAGDGTILLGGLYHRTGGGEPAERGTFEASLRSADPVEPRFVVAITLCGERCHSVEFET
jgi:hypothetical protein